MKAPTYTVEDSPEEITEVESVGGYMLQLAPGNKVLRDDDGKVFAQVAPADFELQWETIDE
jgi:hypothetical protein